MACASGYSTFWENVKYLGQAAYLVPTALLYARILYVMWFKYRKTYTAHQFFVIYSIDGTVGLLLLLLDILITRLFVYLPQLCHSGSQFFQSHAWLMHLYYPLLNYLHCAQPLVQIFLTTNRMSSVLWPVDHNKMWANKMALILVVVLLTPFAFIWNTLISDMQLIYYFGGFFILGQRRVVWADVSLFLFAVRLIAVVITVVSTSVMFFRMSRMTKRLVKSERVLCLAGAIHSLCFMVPSLFEALAVFNPVYGSSALNYLLTPFAWDVLTVGSPLIMIFVSSQLRRHVFQLSIFSRKIGVFSAKPSNSAVVTITGQFSN